VCLAAQQGVLVMMMVVVPTIRALLLVLPSQADKAVTFAPVLMFPLAPQHDDDDDDESAQRRLHLQSGRDSPLQRLRLRHFREHGAGWT
jgi:hypothetical protein